ncbi:MAG TPA: hypothetical protein VH916_05935, partial [Dehalococcoidia bacterium]
ALGGLAFGFGFIDPVEDVSYFSYRHRLIPDPLKGRVLAVCRLGPACIRPLGLLLTGLLLQRFGGAGTILITSAWGAALLLAVSLSPDIRTAAGPADSLAV